VPNAGVVPALKIKKQPMPEYPPTMRRQGITGLVVVRAVIGGDGSVTIGKVIQTTQPEFLAAVREAISGWAFSLAQPNNQNAPKELDYSFRFDLIE
jgi:protein TonB